MCMCMCMCISLKYSNALNFMHVHINIYTNIHKYNHIATKLKVSVKYFSALNFMHVYTYIHTPTYSSHTNKVERIRQVLQRRDLHACIYTYIHQTHIITYQ